ncbi:MAG: hypothetical protein LBM92_02375, partial [Opitutaceae bacterium]|nr:hypothetical protein [Opitutaceae bacterium]
MSNENKPDFSENKDNIPQDNRPAASLDDPRLTACALGEMDDAERAAFEAEISGDPAAQAALAEIRALAGNLRHALASEGAAASPPPDAQSAPRDTDFRVLDGGAADIDEVARERERQRERASDPYRRRRRSFPYLLIGGLAAACFAVFFFTQVLPDYRLLQAARVAQIKQAGELAGMKNERPLEFTPIGKMTTAVNQDGVALAEKSATIQYAPPPPLVTGDGISRDVSGDI